MPRMLTSAPTPVSMMLSDGVVNCSMSILSMPRFFRSSPVSTVAATAAFCRLTSRRSAVITRSWTLAVGLPGPLSLCDGATC